MPVKWTSETDQILLLKILETSDISPKCAEIAAKWPTGLDRPTPRAVSERIFKIRNTAKTTGTTSNASTSPAAKSNTGTPRKNVVNNAIKKSLPKKRSGGKRKRGAMSDDEASDDTEADMFKSTDNGTDASDDEEAPVKKASKTNGAANGKRQVKSKTAVKMEHEEEEEEENKTVHDKGYENAFDEDDGTDYA